MSDELPQEAARLAAGLGEAVPGTRIAGYLLQEQIGRGGMAVVFRAEDERLARQVALKILAPALSADDAFRKRFSHEARAAAAVDHPHIIPVFEAGQTGQFLFIAMRYVSGGDVLTRVSRSGPLAARRAAGGVISPVASALDAAHSRGLVHRDVKPANMLLDEMAGRPDHVYLADFGLSKASLVSIGLTGTGVFLGTPNYSAPEQIDGKVVDGRTDQYALACSAFEILCGEPPFKRDDGMAVMYAHQFTPPPSITAKQPSLRPAVDQVFARALAKDPAERFGSCREFADALREAIGMPPYHSDPGDSALRGPQTEVAVPSARRPVPAESKEAVTNISPPAGTATWGRNAEPEQAEGGKQGPKQARGRTRPKQTEGAQARPRPARGRTPKQAEGEQAGPKGAAGVPAGPPQQAEGEQAGPKQAAGGEAGAPEVAAGAETGPARQAERGSAAPRRARARTGSKQAAGSEAGPGLAAGQESGPKQAGEKAGPELAAGEETGPPRQAEPGSAAPRRARGRTGSKQAAGGEAGPEVAAGEDTGPKQAGGEKAAPKEAAGQKTQPKQEGVGKAGATHAADGLAGSAGTIGVPVPLARPRRRGWLAAAAIVVVAAVAGGVALSIAHAPARPHPGRPRVVGLAPPGCNENLPSPSPPRLAARVTSTLPLGGSPFGAVIVNSQWHTFLSLTSASRVDVLGNAGPFPRVRLVRKIPLPGQPEGEALDGNYVLVASGAGAYIIDVNAATHRRSHPVVGYLHVHGGSGAVQVAVSNDGRYAFVLFQHNGQLAVFNLLQVENHGFSESFPVQKVDIPFPVAEAVSPSGRFLYVVSEEIPGSPYGSVSELSIRALETEHARVTIRTAPAGCGPDAVTTSATGGTVWVTAKDSNDLLGYSAARLRTDPHAAIIAKVPVGPTPVGLTRINDTEILVDDAHAYSNQAGQPGLALVSIPKALDRQSALLGVLQGAFQPREVELLDHGNRLLVVSDNGTDKVLLLKPAPLP